MLRLRAAECLPWVDSGNRVRSCFEDFRLLGPDAVERLETASGQFALWEFGVVSDEPWMSPEHAKPQRIGEEEHPEDLVTSYSLGAEDAGFRPDLSPLWTDFLIWIAGQGRTRLLAADEVWHEREGWLELGPAITAGCLGPLTFRMTPVGTQGLYTALVGPREIAELTRTWWPSPLGTLVGVGFRNHEAGTVDARLTAGGVLKESDLPMLAYVYQTSGAFENMGVTVVTLGKDWNTLQSELRAKGWTDAAPLEP